MIVFAGMIAEAARKAGMKVPENPDDFDADEFPHFAVFCNAQLCRPTRYHGEHWHNAEVVAAVPADRILTVTLADLIGRGLSGAY